MVHLLVSFWVSFLLAEPLSFWSVALLFLAAAAQSFDQPSPILHGQPPFGILFLLLFVNAIDCLYKLDDHVFITADLSQQKVVLCMSVLIRRLVRAVLIVIGRLLAKILFRVTIEGATHAPRTPNGLLVISNHFSWFDAPILTFLLPFPPAYLIATEAQDKQWIRIFSTIFESIPIWRGQVDRKALTTAVSRLQGGDVIGIFPEGGINPELAALVASGQQITELQGNISRTDGQLVRAKPGVALLAAMSGTEIMPVALMGSQALPSNLKRWRRTPLTLCIGPCFGPLILDPALKGQARRQQMDRLADEMMSHVARLFPPEQRGYYVDKLDN